AGHDADFAFLESRRFEPAMQFTLGKAQPAVAVKLAGLLEVVAEQIENHDLATGLDDAVNGRQRAGGILRVMERPAQPSELDGLRIDGRALQIAQTELEILQGVFP